MFDTLPVFTYKPEDPLIKSCLLNGKYHGNQSNFDI